MLRKLPEFVKAVHGEVQTIVMTADAFVGDNELFGEAIQYAVNHGKTITVIPNNNKI